MNISSILSNIPILRNFTGGASQAQNDPSQSNGQSAEQIREQAIRDTVEVSAAASRALASVDANSDLSDDEVGAILSQTRSTLETNDNVNLGLDQRQAQNL